MGYVLCCDTIIQGSDVSLVLTKFSPLSMDEVLSAMTLYAMMLMDKIFLLLTLNNVCL